VPMINIVHIRFRVPRISFFPANDIRKLPKPDIRRIFAENRLPAQRLSSLVDSQVDPTSMLLRSLFITRCAGCAADRGKADHDPAIRVPAARPTRLCVK
jgi:hypothetical protein